MKYDMKIEINDTIVELRFTFNAFIEFEKHFNEPLSLEPTDMSFDKTVWFYYLVVLCSKKGWQTSAWLSKDDFDEWLNEDPQRILKLAEFVSQNLNLNKILTTGSDKKK